MKSTKGRNWGFVVYPDSLPENYVELIYNMGVPMCFSPLHDMDVNPDGTEKKPHYHVLVYYDNTTTYNNVLKNVCEPLHGTIPIKIENLRSMYRYHIHIDNPEKFQYDDKSRQFFNGFDISRVEALTKTDILKLRRSILDIIEEKNIYEYNDLIDFFNKKDMTDLLDISINSPYFFSTYLKCKKTKLKESIEVFSSSISHFDEENNHIKH